MTKYEAMVITKPDLKEEEKEAVFKQFLDPITKNGGQIINHQVWLAKSHLSSPIKKQKEGLYYLIQFNIASAAIAKLKPVYRLNELILRFMVIKVK